jgi:hypothetical protein
MPTVGFNPFLVIVPAETYHPPKRRLAIIEVADWKNGYYVGTQKIDDEGSPVCQMRTEGIITPRFAITVGGPQLAIFASRLPGEPYLLSLRWVDKAKLGTTFNLAEVTLIPADD